MIDHFFSGTLKKYNPVRVEDNLQIHVQIQHIDESSTQTFLNSIRSTLKTDNVVELFTYPVRWDKIRLNVSDFVQKTYNVTFGEFDFTATLEQITVTRKLVDGSDIFDYSLIFMKLPCDNDKVISEAYLNYKEENDKGKKVIMMFDVKLTLLENVKQTMEEDVSNNF